MGWLSDKLAGSGHGVLKAPLPKTPHEPAEFAWFAGFAPSPPKPPEAFTPMSNPVRQGYGACLRSSPAGIFGR